ncbi:hypothetical protein GCM10007140_12190 [Priestia taiwanensis]|uniref:Uncharacterized protein n=2 Tax=Priestia taiwanensis TaxID=1347902 RepID=A0A917ANE5_9BACI|nr:hypothetical protein GCM10007140_12190 [Priestia taiwanensis]
MANLQSVADAIVEAVTGKKVTHAPKVETKAVYIRTYGVDADGVKAFIEFIYSKKWAGKVDITGGDMWVKCETAELVGSMVDEAKAFVEGKGWWYNVYDVK